MVLYHKPTCSGPVRLPSPTVSKDRPRHTNKQITLTGTPKKVAVPELEFPACRKGRCAAQCSTSLSVTIVCQTANSFYGQHKSWHAESSNSSDWPGHPCPSAHQPSLIGSSCWFEARSRERVPSEPSGAHRCSAVCHHLRFHSSCQEFAINCLGFPWVLVPSCTNAVHDRLSKSIVLELPPLQRQHRH